MKKTKFKGMNNNETKNTKNTASSTNNNSNNNINNNNENMGDDHDDKVFTLKHPGSCTGMFWRGNPDSKGKEKQSGNKEWPRNGSLLKGKIHEKSDMKWLEITSWKQANKEVWVYDCVGLWMPFEQEGLLLHECNN
eukprot:Pgem_evm1s9013